MLIKLLMAAFPVVATVGIHTLGFAALLRAIMWSHALTKTGFWRRPFSEQPDVLVDFDPLGRNFLLGAILFLAGLFT